MEVRERQGGVREAHLEVRDRSGDPSGGPRGIGSLPGSMGQVGRPTRRSRRDQEANPKVQEGSGGPPGVLGGVGRPVQSTERGREAHLKGWEVSGVPPEGPGRVGRLMWMARRGREAHPEVREGSGGSARVPGVVGKLNRRSGKGQKALPEVWEELGGPLGCEEVSGGPTVVPGGVGSPSQGFGNPPGGPGCVGRPSCRAERGQQTHPKVREESVGPRVSLGGVKRHTRRSGRGWEAQPEVWERSRAHPYVWVGCRPIRRFGRCQEALLEVHLEVREAHLELQVGSGGSPGGLGRGREAHPEIWEELGGPTEGLGGIGMPTCWARRSTQRSKRPTRKSGSGRESHPEVLEGTDVPPGGPGS